MSTATPLPLPPMNLRLMSDSDEKFRASGIQLAKLLYRFGLEPNGRLLDVGCSVGRVPIGLEAIGFHGRYFGFDVMRKQVEWARRTLTPVAARYKFSYVDVRNDRYNPKGSVDPRTLRFPVPDATYDMACLFSIFTHFYKEDIQLYLRELRRSIRPGGSIVVSWFLYDDKNRDAVKEAAYPMTFRLDDVTVYNNEEDPLRAIAFSEKYARGVIAAAGLDVVSLEHGTWKGGPGPEFQDHFLLRRPKSRGDALVVARAEATRIAKGLRRRVRAQQKRRRSGR